MSLLFLRSILRFLSTVSFSSWAIKIWRGRYSTIHICALHCFHCSILADYKALYTLSLALPHSSTYALTHTHSLSYSLSLSHTRLQTYSLSFSLSLTLYLSLHLTHLLTHYYLSLCIGHFTDIFDVVFMDLHMPVMDGIEATKRYREYERNVHIKNSIKSVEEVRR